MLRRADALDDAAVPRETLYDIAWRIFGSTNGVNLELPPRGAVPGREPPDFRGPEYDP